MYASVRSRFISFNEGIEKRVTYMYLDVKGLVTIGVGNLIDVEKANDVAGQKKILEEVVTLPFVYKKGGKAGTPASKADIEAEWKKVKAKQEWKNVKDSYKLFANITDLKIEDTPINDLVLKKADAMERELKMDAAYRDFDQWPADAQFGLLSMSWALGATKLKTGWPKFKAACLKQNFDDAAKECEIISAGNPGVIPRNFADRQMFKNAAAVMAGQGKDQTQNSLARMVLYYPGMIMKPVVVHG